MQQAPCLQKLFAVVQPVVSLISAPSTTDKQYALVTNGYESAKALNSITINHLPITPAPVALATQIYAGTGTIASLTATGTSLLWYAATTGGSALPTTTNLVNGSTYYVSQTTSGGESTRTAVKAVKISDATQSFCGTATVASLTSTPSTSTTVKWFTTATEGSALESSTALITDTYYVEQATATSTIILASGFNSPSGVAVQSDGKILVADTANNTIKRMNTDGTSIVTLGSGFNFPSGVAIQSDGKIVVADYGNNKIKRMNADGTGIVTLGSGFSTPYGVAIQSDGKIVVVDYGNNKIKRMKADGTSIVTLGSGFSEPATVAIQSDGKIVVADLFSGTIKRMNTDGTGIITLASGFNSPTGIAIQADGKIVVADTYNNVIKRMNADGTGITTLASSFNTPFGVAIQADGKILVADLNNSTIKVISDGTTSNRVAVSVVVNTIPAAPTGSANQTLSESNATLGSIVVSPANVIWYASQTDAIDQTNALSPTTMATNGTTYYAVNKINDCASNAFAVTVTFPLTNSTFDNIINSVKIYPNPTTGLVTVNIANLMDAKLQVLDITGKVLINQSLINKATTIDLKYLTSGMYLFKVSSNQGNSISKIIKN